MPWVYSNGCSWVPLDNQAQASIEALWLTNSWKATSVYSTTFRAFVSIDFFRMSLKYGEYEYTIARQ